MIRRILGVVVVLQLGVLAWAGGPEYVAGASFFDSSSMGSPLTWAQGAIGYSTDQGDLSSILPGPSADSFVANAFGVWTAVPTAAISAAHAGQLAEDVNGTNLMVVNGVITAPADIPPSATTMPVGIVYDQDGSVTDALLGVGASGSANCADNSVFGGIDNLGTNAQFLHALIILNGNCAQSSSQLPDFGYHLVRVIGRVLGLDWSQANLNVITGNPPPAAADFSGFPVMHEFDPTSCTPVAICYSNNGSVDPSQPKMDESGSTFAVVSGYSTEPGKLPGQADIRASHCSYPRQSLLYRRERECGPTHARRKCSRALDGSSYKPAVWLRGCNFSFWISVLRQCRKYHYWLVRQYGTKFQPLRFERHYARGLLRCCGLRDSEWREQRAISAFSGRAQPFVVHECWAIWVNRSGTAFGVCESNSRHGDIGRRCGTNHPDAR